MSDLTYLSAEQQEALKRCEAATMRERLLLARRQEGFTQTALGAALDPPRSHAAISDMERGITRIAAIDLAQVAAITKRSVTWFYGEGQPDPPAALEALDAALANAKRWEAESQQRTKLAHRVADLELELDAALAEAERWKSRAKGFQDQLERICSTRR